MTRCYYLSSDHDGDTKDANDGYFEYDLDIDADQKYREKLFSFPDIIVAKKRRRIQPKIKPIQYPLMYERHSHFVGQKWKIIFWSRNKCDLIDCDDKCNVLSNL